jgi:hypothetical protein
VVSAKLVGIAMLPLVPVTVILEAPMNVDAAGGPCPIGFNNIKLGDPGPDFRTWETTNFNQRFSDP